MTRTNENAAGSPLARWAAGVGLVLLIVSFAVASMAMKPAAGETPSTPADATGKRSVAVARVDVEGGVSKSLYPVKQGRVVAVPHREGEPIKGGAILLRTDDTLAKLDKARAVNALAAANEKLVQARTLVVQHKKKARAMVAAVNVAKADVEAARVQASKAKRYFTEKLGGSQEDVDVAGKLVEKAERGVEAREAELDVLLAIDPQAAVRLAEMDVKDKERLIEAADVGIREHEVRAPCDGSLLRLGVSVGDVLGASPRLPIMEFCPAGPRIVRAEVEQEFASMVKVGQSAVLHDDATGGGSWKGKVLRIGDWFAKRRGQLFEPMEFNDVLTLEVILAVEPNSDQPLRIGQRMRVQIGDR